MAVDCSRLSLFQIFKIHVVVIITLLWLLQNCLSKVVSGNNNRDSNVHRSTKVSCDSSPFLMICIHVIIRDQTTVIHQRKHDISWERFEKCSNS